VEIGSLGSFSSRQNFEFRTSDASNTQEAELPQAAIDKGMSKQAVEQEVEGINNWLRTTNTHIKFTLHEKLNEYYIQVINDQTNEVVREIPSKKIMDIAAKLHEMIGILVDEKR